MPCPLWRSLCNQWLTHSCCSQYFRLFLSLRLHLIIKRNTLLTNFRMQHGRDLWKKCLSALWYPGALGDKMLVFSGNQLIPCLFHQTAHSPLVSSSWWDGPFQGRDTLIPSSFLPSQHPRNFFTCSASHHADWPHSQLCLFPRWDYWVGAVVLGLLGNWLRAVPVTHALDGGTSSLFTIN